MVPNFNPPRAMCRANEAIMPPLFGEPAGIVAYGNPFKVMNVDHHLVLTVLIVLCEVFSNLVLKTCIIKAASELLTAPIMTEVGACMVLRPFRVPNDVAPAEGISSNVNMR